MARKRFDSLTGGLVDSVITSVAKQTSGIIENISTGQEASFSINSALGEIVESTAGFALNQGQNYLISQMSSSLGNVTDNALVNSVITQVATAGINEAVGFVSEGITNFFTGGSATNVTTEGSSQQAARSTISIPDSVVSQLEDADYGGNTYTLNDIVFTLVPANAGAQTQQPPQTSPTLPLDVGFDAKAAASLPLVDALKGATALAGPAKGTNIGGRNFGANYALGSAPKVRNDLFENVAPLRAQPLW